MTTKDRYGTGLKGAFKMAAALVADKDYSADSAARFVANVFSVDKADVADALRRGFVVETELSENDEGSNFAAATITFADGTVETEHFAQWVDSGEGVESAARQAASYVGAMFESTDYTLEERLGAYGLRWEQEHDEREGGF